MMTTVRWNMNHRLLSLTNIIVNISLVPLVLAVFIFHERSLNKRCLIGETKNSPEGCKLYFLGLIKVINWLLATKMANTRSWVESRDSKTLWLPLVTVMQSRGCIVMSPGLRTIALWPNSMGHSIIFFKLGSGTELLQRFSSTWGIHGRQKTIVKAPMIPLTLPRQFSLPYSPLNISYELYTLTADDFSLKESKRYPKLRMRVTEGFSVE